MSAECLMPSYFKDLTMDPLLPTPPPLQLEFLSDAGLIMTVNVRAATKLSPPSSSSSSSGSSSSSSSSAPVSSPLIPPIASTSTYVSASSPRMRVAFRLLTADPRLQQQTGRIGSALRVAMLRRAEDELVKKKLPEALAERSHSE